MTTGLNVSGIPAELKQLPQWLLWRYEGKANKNGKRDKVPYQPSGRKASVSDPSTWSAFGQVLDVAPRYTGIGIACANGLAGIDIDNCLDDSGNPSELARHIVTRMQTYTEVTPSGHGLRCYFDGKLPGPGFKDDERHVEFYDSGRYFTVTGQQWPGAPCRVEQREQQAAELYHEFRPVPPNPLAALVVPASIVAQSNPRPVEWDTDKFIQRGELVLLTAMPGMMKSLFMLFWACCLAAGRKFLTRPDGSGGRSTRQAAVLWLNTDNGQSTHDDRLRAVMRTLGVSDIPLFSLTTTDFELANPEHVKNLHLLADELAVEVIVIDTLSGCLNGVNENTAEEMTVPAAHLRALAGTGRTVVGIHHPPKNDAEGSRGSSVLPGKVDRVFSLNRDGDLLFLKPQKVRNAPGGPMVALAALESDVITEALLSIAFYDGGSTQQLAELQKVKDRILEALEGGPLNARKLRAAAKGRGSLTTEATSSLVLAGHIRMETGSRGAKLYKLADERVP